MVIRHRRQPSFNAWDCLYGYLTVQNCAAIFNTRMARESGGFDTSLNMAMDYDLVLKLAARGEVRHVPTFAGQFRFHAEAKTSRMRKTAEDEVAELRKTLTGCSAPGLAARYAWAKTRVALRMLREGCVPCRLGLGDGSGD